ncbi:MAG: helix-turn-helix transcriptional regulator [Pseudomonadota bacterium]
MLRGFPVRIERSAANDEFLHQIYDLSLGADRWDHITSKLCRAAGADSAILFRLAHGSQPPVFFGVANGHDRSAVDAYSERYHLVDEFADFAETLLPPPHTPFTAKEVLGADTLSKSEWYQDFIKTQGYGSIGSILLSPAGGDVGRLGFTYLRASGGRDFSAEDVADIVGLSTHMKRAFDLDDLLARHQARYAAILTSFDHLAFGVLIVDRQCRVVEANRYARDILDRGDEIGLSNNRLSIDQADCGLRLEMAVRQAVDHGPGEQIVGIDTILVPRNGDHQPYTLATLPLQNHGDLAGHAIVFVFDGHPGERSLALGITSTFSLSASEAQLAAALTAGRTLADHADETGTSINTVRWMLKQVFAKTQTNSQRDLVRLVLRSPAGGLSTRNGS